MKNKNFLFLIIILTGLFGFWLWLLRVRLPIDEVMPAGVVFYVHMNHVEKHVNEMLQSDFGKSLVTIDLPEVLAQNHFPAKDIDDWQQWQKDLQNIWGNPLTRRFLSKEIAVCVLNKDNHNEVFMTLRLTALAKTAEFVGRFFSQWSQEVSLNSQNYHGHAINHVVLKRQGLAFAYVRLADLLIAAPQGYGRLEDIVDVYQHRQPSLKRDDQFMFVKHNAYPKGDALVFVNMDLSLDLLRKELDLRLENDGHENKGFAIYGLSYMPGEVSKYKMIAGFNEKSLPEGIQKNACSALANDSLRLIPVSAIAYHWGGCYDLQDYWQWIQEKLPANSAWADIVRKITEGLERRLSINIKQEVLPILGHEMGGYLTDIDMQGKYPFPRLLVFVKVKDRPAAQRLLDKLQVNPIAAVHDEDYQGVKIHYITLPLGGNIDPGYGFIDDYLLAATSRQLLKLSIDSYSNSMRSLVSDDVVKQFSLDGTSRFHSVTLMKTAEVARRVQDFLGWINKYLSSQVSMAAAFKQDGASKAQEIDQAVADKKEELRLAKQKLAQLKSKTMRDVSDEDALLITGTIANLSREEETMRQEILSYKEQKQKLSDLLERYASGAVSDKLAMFNMENILSPVLKGLESIDAQAVTVRFYDKTLETEILVK